MINVIKFGEKLKELRKLRNFTQKDVSDKIGVSDQAVSKWEKGECLPDVWNLKLLAQIYRVSIDSLLCDDERGEKIIDTIKIGNALFEVIEKAETILAGKIVYENETIDINQALEAFSEEERQLAFNSVIDCVKPVYDVHLSIDFWKHGSNRGMGFVRETTSSVQPNGLDVFIMPASLFVRAYTDKATAQLLTKEKCEIWELFAYIRNYFMPTHGYKMAINGAQEMEVFDTSEHTTGYAYMPVIKI